MQDLPALNQLNVIVKNMAATVDFYRRLGVPIAADHDDNHVDVNLPNGLLIEFDTEGFVPAWDSGWNSSTPSMRGGLVIGFRVASRESVDALYAELTTAGGRPRQPPYDAFWGARYAIVEDPDGNAIGLMSPKDAGRKFWPPGPLPRA
jgi:catechol 2,3-dioxygenase-like lactoylglutathione lyase family enzyme